MSGVKHELKFLELARQKHFTVLGNGDINRIKSKRYKSGCYIKLFFRIGYGGYYCFRFSYLRKRYYVAVHRAVYSFFQGEIPDGMQINHKDGNKNNNALSNLEMVTPRENYLHARYVIKTNKCFGINHPFARLKPAHIGKIMYYRQRHNLTLEQLAYRFGVSTTQIWKVCRLKSWRCLFEREDSTVL
jgi:hypothetical protein